MDNLQIIIEAKHGYQGVTPEERMALRHVFDNEKADLANSKQFPDYHEAGEQ